MNYLREINSFYDWLETNTLTDSAINLWHALMHVANKAGWPEEFAVAISTLESKTGLKKDAIIRARNQLQQSGRIKFRSRSGRQSAVYKIIPFSCVGLNDANREQETVCVGLNDAERNTNREQTATQTATINKLNKTKQKKSKNIDMSKFEIFYQAYPRHQAKKDAAKAWTQVNGDKHFEEIMAAVEIQKKYVDAWVKNDIEHIPLPASWLRGERWKDEIKVSQQPVKSQPDLIHFEPWQLEAQRKRREKLAKHSAGNPV